MIFNLLKAQRIDRPATTQSFGERKELCKKSFGWRNKKNHESYDGSSNSKRFVTACSKTKVKVVNEIKEKPDRRS